MTDPEKSTNEGPEIATWSCPDGHTTRTEPGTCSCGQQLQPATTTEGMWWP